MGQHAEDAISDVISEEFARDKYVSGYTSMQEAYDCGFIDEVGTEQGGIQEAWDRSIIPTIENLNTEIKDATKDFIIASAMNVEGTVTGRTKLISKAVKNLSNKVPTCNKCDQLMKTREGQYGKFYFCDNRCAGQGTVSDKYWQSIRR